MIDPMSAFITDQAAGLACATSWAAAIFILVTAVILASKRWGWHTPARLTVPIGALGMVYGWRGWTLAMAPEPQPAAILSTATLALVALLVMIEVIVRSWRRATRHQVEAEAAAHVAQALGPLPPHLPGQPRQTRADLH